MARLGGSPALVPSENTHFIFFLCSFEVSGQSNPDMYTHNSEKTEETVSLLQENMHDEAESSPEAEVPEDEDSNEVKPTLLNNGVHPKEDGVELQELKFGDGEGTVLLFLVHTIRQAYMCNVVREGQ